MSESKVNSALVQAFKALNLFDDAHTALENVPFDPPNAAAWAELFFMPNERTVATLGLNGQDRLTGIFQIDLYYPQGKGTKPAGDTADSIVNAFTANHRFAYSNQEVICSRSGRSPGRIENRQWKVSITVSFYADINR